MNERCLATKPVTTAVACRQRGQVERVILFDQPSSIATATTTPPASSTTPTAVPADTHLGLHRHLRLYQWTGFARLELRRQRFPMQRCYRHRLQPTFAAHRLADGHRGGPRRRRIQRMAEGRMQALPSWHSFEKMLDRRLPFLPPLLIDDGRCVSAAHLRYAMANQTAAPHTAATHAMTRAQVTAAHITVRATGAHATNAAATEPAHGACESALHIVVCAIRDGRAADTVIVGLDASVAATATLAVVNPKGRGGSSV